METKQCNFINKTTKSSLQVCSCSYQAKNQKNKINNCSTKRTSSFLSIQASMTIEGAIGIPLFLFFMITILSLIHMYQEYSVGLSDLHQQGKQLAMYGYGYGEIIAFDDDMVELNNYIEVKPIISEMIFPTIYALNKCYMRQWTGYDVEHVTEESIEDEYVYITENGTVYHESRSCSYLNLSIKMIDKSALLTSKNVDGTGYSPCELCGDAGMGDLYYITDYGTRYHKSLSCSGLKRTIQSILRSEINGRPPCSRCS
ncbi:MAG: hypothetical protein R3Y24_06235 [Eubacteriales bacterium]